jgi:multimeric flavodoxin WrbA
MKAIIILGSSDSNGKTRQLTDELIKNTDWDFVDLKTKNIQHFDYEYQNQADDFLPLITEIIENYDLLIFATPVYWYTMSGMMKVFFDRFSDLLKIHKPLGRQLRTRKMAVICSGADKVLVNGFYMPFRESAKYLGMEYLGEFYGNLEDNELADLKKGMEQFRESLL